MADGLNPNDWELYKTMNWDDITYGAFIINLKCDTEDLFVDAIVMSDADGVKITPMYVNSECMDCCAETFAEAIALHYWNQLDMRGIV